MLAVFGIFIDMLIRSADHGSRVIKSSIRTTSDRYLLP